MKTNLRWLAMLFVLLTASVFIPISSAQEEEDFISISPVDQKDTSTMMNSDAIEGQPVAAKSTPGQKEPPKAAEAKPKAVEPKTAAGNMAGIDKILTLDLADRSEVRIITSSRVKYKATELAPPPNTRILIQLSNCGVKGATINVGKGGVEKVRSAPHNSTAWVVIDLQEKLKWKVRDDGEIIVVEIPKGGAAPKTYTEEAPKATGAASGMIYRVIDVAGKNIGKKTRVIVTTDGPVKYRVKKDSANRQVVLDVLDAVSIWQKGNFTMDGSSVSTVNLKEDKAAKVVGINIGLSDNLPYTVTRDQNQIVIEVDNSSASGKLPKKKLDLYQKISINIQDASLPGVLRLLSTQTGFEFAVSPSVSAAKPVTIREDEQTLDQVLRDILIPQDLFYDVDDNIIKVGSVAEIKAAKQLGEKRASFYYPKTMLATDLKLLLDTQVAKAPLMDVAVQVDGTSGANRLMLVGSEDDLVKTMGMISSIDHSAGMASQNDTAGESEDGDYYVIKVYKLNNIRLQSELAFGLQSNLSGSYISYEEKFVSELRAAFEKIKTADGSIDFDRRTSSVIVNDIAKVHKKIAKFIKAIDVKVAQVSIEAKIYEIDVNETKELGIIWNNKTTGSEPYIQQDTQLGNNALPSAGLGVGNVINLGFIQNGFKINAYLNALETRNKATVLSSPKVTVDVNQPARIETSRTIWYESQSLVQNPTGPPTIVASFLSVNVPLRLVVICKDTKEDSINMMIHLDVSQVISSARSNGPPDITQQIADTVVKAKNNETIVIGGLVSDQVSEVENKVPFLGDLPLLGALFRSTEKNKKKVELVLFLTPTLLEE